LEGQKKWGDLVSLYAPLASEDGGDSEIRLSLGRGYRALRRFDESRDQLDAVLKNGPERGTLLAQIQLERGKVEFDRERFAESLPYLLKASELAPTDPPTLLYLAGAYYRNKQYKEAAATYERALSLEPKNDQTERYLAMALLEGGETAKGEAIFKRLLERGKEDPSLYYHLARIREGAGDRSGAVAYLESALRKDPDYRNARILLDKLVGRSTP
jgi:tetratricopeptide (TPR) repeat protein